MDTRPLRSTIGERYNVNPRVCLCAIAAAITVSGCVHYYDGTVAELEVGPGLTVTLAVPDYGDCFRSNPDVPVVYGLERPRYSLRIAHGMRYWPEFFLIARQ